VFKDIQHSSVHFNKEKELRKKLTVRLSMSDGQSGPRWAERAMYEFLLDSDHYNLHVGLVIIF
jgi:hypothetical protein